MTWVVSVASRPHKHALSLVPARHREHLVHQRPSSPKTSSRACSIYLTLPRHVPIIGIIIIIIIIIIMIMIMIIIFTS